MTAEEPDVVPEEPNVVPEEPSGGPEPVSDEETASESPGALRRFVQRHVRGLTIGAVLAGMATALSLVVTVLDLWDRVFGEDGVKPVPTLTVERELVTDVSWQDYLRAHPEASTRPSYTEPQLMALGEEFRVTGQVEGRSGKQAVLTWEVFQPPGTPLALPPWAPRRVEGRVSANGRIEFRPWVAVPDGAGELYPKFMLTVEDTTQPPTATGPTLTIARG